MLGFQMYRILCWSCFFFSPNLIMCYLHKRSHLWPCLHTCQLSNPCIILIQKFWPKGLGSWDAVGTYCPPVGEKPTHEDCTSYAPFKNLHDILVGNFPQMSPIILASMLHSIRSVIIIIIKLQLTSGSLAPSLRDLSFPLSWLLPYSLAPRP